MSQKISFRYKIFSVKCFRYKIFLLTVMFNLSNSLDFIFDVQMFNGTCKFFAVSLLEMEHCPSFGREKQQYVYCHESLGFL